MVGSDTTLVSSAAQISELSSFLSISTLANKMRISDPEKKKVLGIFLFEILNLRSRTLTSVSGCRNSFH